MRIHMDEEKKIAEIWLTKAESSDPAVDASRQVAVAGRVDPVPFPIVPSPVQDPVGKKLPPLLRHQITY